MLLIILTALLAENAATKPADAGPGSRPEIVLALGGPQRESDNVKWANREGGDAVAEMVRDCAVVVVGPNGRKFPVKASNFTADSSAGLVWHALVRPAWQRTSKRHLAALVQGLLGEWDVPLTDGSKLFLEQMSDAPGGEAPNGPVSVQRCLLYQDDQMTIRLELHGTARVPKVTDGGWFVVLECSLRKRPEAKSADNDSSNKR